MTDVTQLPWRVGSHYGIHVYACVEGPGVVSDADIPVATFLDSRAATHACHVHNRGLKGRAVTDAQNRTVTDGT